MLSADGPDVSSCLLRHRTGAATGTPVVNSYRLPMPAALC